MKKLQPPILAALAFFIPGAVMLSVLIRAGFYPFGETSLLIMDMDGQYVQFYEYLRHIAFGGDPSAGSIFFTWSKTFGSNFTGLFAYYLSSPLSLFMLAFSDAQMGIFWLTVFKIALCGLSSFFYFRYALGCKGGAVLLFTSSYALMSYNMVYSMCLMWLDGVILLPLVLFGIEKLLRGGRPYLLISFLALSLTANFYTGYMVCLFGVLYALYRYYSVPEQERTLSFRLVRMRFLVSYAAALGLSLWLLLPAFFDMMTGKIRFEGYFPATVFNFPIKLYLESFTRGGYTSITNRGSAPALYSGAVIAALIFIFFALPSVRRRVKLYTAVFFTLLLGSFIFIFTDVVWHMFQYPNWFPYRYAFVFSMLAVSVACTGWQALRRHLKIPAPILYIPLLALICWDMHGNSSALLKGLDSQFGYKPAALHTDFRAETMSLIDLLQASDGDFYRIENTSAHTLNDALGLGYKSITHYSSMYNRSILNVTGGLGMAQTHFWNGYTGSTPVTDSLLNVKYILSGTALPYQTLVESNGVTVYQNPNVLPPAFMVDGVSPVKLDGDCFAAQNAILRTLGGTDVFRPLEGVSVRNRRYSFIAEDSLPVYARFTEAQADIYVNRTRITPHYYPSDGNNAFYVGSFMPGAKVEIRLLGGQEPDGVYIYALDTVALAENAALLSQGGLTEIEYTASSLRGRVSAARDGYLFVSVPYDKGWTVRINGSKVKTERALGAFLAVPSGAGEHYVELSFRPRGLTAGILLSLLTLTVVLLISKKVLTTSTVSRIMTVLIQSYRRWNI